MRLVLFAIAITLGSFGVMVQQTKARDSAAMPGVSYATDAAPALNGDTLTAVLAATLAQGRAIVGLQDPAAAQATARSLPQVNPGDLPIMPTTGAPDPAAMARVMQDIEQQIEASPGGAPMVTSIDRTGGSGARFVKARPRD